MWKSNLQQLQVYSLFTYATCFFKIELLGTFDIEKLEGAHMSNKSHIKNTSNKLSLQMNQHMTSIC
jgi:hypothetical protein